MRVPRMRRDAVQENRPTSHRYRPTLEPLEDRTLLTAALALDINLNTRSSGPASPVSLGKSLIFGATDLEFGNELWRSDGTAEGTVLVRDINPGPAQSFPTHFYNANGTLYFVADDGVHGNQLWTSDGTSAGTRLVMDLFNDPVGLTNLPPSYANIGNALYFTANAAGTGRRLWRTDGTTNTLIEIEPGKRLPTHHDGAEEVLYIVQGEATASIGSESGKVRAGDLAVIPAWAPHGVVNTGDVTLKVVGFFGNATVAHMFAEQLFPGDGAFVILHTADGEAAYSANSLQPAGIA